MDRGDGFDNRSGSERDTRVRAVRSSQEAVFQDAGILSHLGSYLPDSGKLSFGLVNKSALAGVARPHMIKKIRGMTREQVLELNWNTAHGIEIHDRHGSVLQYHDGRREDTPRGYMKGVSPNIGTQPAIETDWNMDRGGYRAAPDTSDKRRDPDRPRKIWREREARRKNRKRRGKTKIKLEQSIGRDVVYPQGKANYIRAYSLKRDSMNPFFREATTSGV